MINKILRSIKSRFSMKRGKRLFLDGIEHIYVYTYIDMFGDKWAAIYPFFPWSHRMKLLKDTEIKPCNFDHNGECLICNCWVDYCAWDRYLNKNYDYEQKQELEIMFKDKINHV